MGVPKWVPPAGEPASGHKNLYWVTSCGNWVTSCGNWVTSCSNWAPSCGNWAQSPPCQMKLLVQADPAANAWYMVPGTRHQVVPGATGWCQVPQDGARCHRTVPGATGRCQVPQDGAQMPQDVTQLLQDVTQLPQDVTQYKFFCPEACALPGESFFGTPIC